MIIVNSDFPSIEKKSTFGHILIMTSESIRLFHYVIYIHFFLSKKKINMKRIKKQEMNSQPQRSNANFGFPSFKYYQYQCQIY